MIQAFYFVFHAINRDIKSTQKCFYNVGNKKRITRPPKLKRTQKPQSKFFFWQYKYYFHAIHKRRRHIRKNIRWIFIFFCYTFLLSLFVLKKYEWHKNTETFCIILGELFELPILQCETDMDNLRMCLKGKRLMLFLSCCCCFSVVSRASHAFFV